MRNRLAANKIIKDAVRVKVGAVRVKVASKRRREVRLENEHAQVYNWISGGVVDRVMSAFSQILELLSFEHTFLIWCEADHPRSKVLTVKALCKGRRDGQ